MTSKHSQKFWEKKLREINYKIEQLMKEKRKIKEKYYKSVKLEDQMQQEQEDKTVRYWSNGRIRRD